ncbi:MAG: mechanosensitive ion channel family protein [Clostridiales bacterium]|nr:mechanosensitive ion channel family protein [Clostridiales bacterium]
MGEIDFLMVFQAVKPWLIVAAILLLGWAAVKIISKTLTKTLKKTALDPTLHKFINNITVTVCWIVLIGVALPVVGVSLSAFLTMLGVAGAAIALALKDSLGNIAGGIIVIVSKPFKKGDIVETGGATGKVDEIGLLFTTLLTADNKIVYIPNGKLSTSTITNCSSERNRRVDCRFGIGSASSISKAKEVLAVIAEQSDLILKDPAPVIGIAEHSEGIVFIDMKVWCRTGDSVDVRYFLEENVKIAFDEAGIEMQAPNIIVHFKKQ